MYIDLAQVICSMRICAQIYTHVSTILVLVKWKSLVKCVHASSYFIGTDTVCAHMRQLLPCAGDTLALLSDIDM
jgi:hypothetical protein